MFVVEVIPLKKHIGVGSLSYYAANEYPIGTILHVPVRNSNVASVVIESKPVSVAKTALRTATFSLKKLQAQEKPPKLPRTLMRTAEALSAYVPAHIGAILFALLPPDIRAGVRAYPNLPDHEAGQDSTPMILTGTYKDRYISYRSNIRQCFAHRGSVLFVLPTSADVDYARAQLEHGIEKRVITFCRTHTKKQLENAYTQFEDLSQAKLIITTPSFAFLNRHDITTIIVEQCGSPHYISRMRPYLDARMALKQYAKQSGRTIILGDSLPVTEDEYARREERYGTYEEHTKRLEFSSTLSIAAHEHPSEEREFTLCTQELKETMYRTIANRGRVFLYAARRGLAPIVTCYDCGTVFRDPDSGAPYSLLRTTKDGEEQRWFYSSASGKRVRAADTCDICGSWRLREQGIGIQHVYDVIKKEFPELETFLLDHTTANTHAKAKRIIKQFYETKKAVLIGTSMTLPYLSKPIECSAVVSYEATRALPTWRADESILSLLLKLREITSKDVVVQTRNEPDELLSLASKGLVDQFYDGEIALRRALHYPPFATFILLTFSGSKAQTQALEETVTKHLPEANIQFYSAPRSTNTKTIRHGLLRIDAQSYPSTSLVEGLRTLPPSIKIEIDPSRIV